MYGSKPRTLMKSSISDEIKKKNVVIKRINNKVMTNTDLKRILNSFYTYLDDNDEVLKSGIIRIKDKAGYHSFNLTTKFGDNTLREYYEDNFELTDAIRDKLFDKYYSVDIDYSYMIKNKN